MAVDSQGKVERLWVGRLPEETGDDIAKLVLDVQQASAKGGSQASSNYLSLQALRRYARGGLTQVIDVRDRANEGAPADVVVMPLMELSTRAPFELNRKALQVVDCSNIPDTMCTSAVGRLSNLGFQVATLGAGSLYENCDVSEVADSR